MKSKTLRLFGTCIVFATGTSLSFAVSPEVLWASTAGGTGGEVPRRVVYGNGLIYVAGWFNSPEAVFGDYLVANRSTEANPPMDSFLAQYGYDGTCFAVQGIGGTDEDRLPGLAVDALNNCYVTGSFASSNLFVGETILTNYASPGNSSTYTAKFDLTGALTWVSAPTASAREMGGSAIAVNAAGECYVAGAFSGTHTTTGSLASQGGTDLLLLKYDAEGGLLWARRAGGTGHDSAVDLALDSSGNPVVLASVSSASAEFGSFIVTNQGVGADLVLARFDPAGNVASVRSLGGNGVETGRAIRVDGSGHAYVAGETTSAILVLGNVALTNTAFSGLGFLVKVDPQGQVSWARKWTGDGTTSCTGLAIDAAGNSYLSGFFDGDDMVFDTLEVTNSGGALAMTADAFIAKFTPDGALRWLLQSDGAGEQRAFSVAVDPLANVYVTGWTEGADVQFGNVSVTSGSMDMFLLKLDADDAVLKLEGLSDGMIAMTWSITRSAFVLESSTNLLSWEPAAYVMQTGAEDRITTYCLQNSPRMFFRLRKPEEGVFGKDNSQ